MKSNVNENREMPVSPSLLIVGAVALVATAFGVGAFTSMMQEQESRNQDVALMQHLLNARRSNALIQYINKGQRAEAQQLLNFSLQGEMNQAEVLTDGANAQAVAELKFAMAKIAATEKAHPEYYSMEKPAVVMSPKGVELARH